MIELLVVMIIIAVLAAIAIPLYLGQRERAKNATAMEGGRQIAIALLSRVADSEADDPWPSECTPAALNPYLAAPWPANPFADGELMHQVSAPSLGNFLYVGEPASGGAAPRHHLEVTLKGRDPFVVP
jgi:type II secretory pathway pseudopilin PulG